MSENFEEFRMRHLIRTAEVWRQLCELGATEETLLDFDFTYTSRSKAAVETLERELETYSLAVSSEGLIRKTYRVGGKSGPITWTEEQLLKWVDYLIAVGQDTGCEFDGCGANAP